MRRIYYDEQGGIILISTGKIIPAVYQGYIDVDHPVQIDNFTVDLETKELVAKPE